MKKVYSDSERKYRSHCKPGPGEVCFQVVVEETDLRVTAGKDLARAVAARVNELRGEIKAFMEVCPKFRTSLTAIGAPRNAPEVVRRMAAGSAVFGIGPFASVAGVIAQMTAESFVHESPDIVIENGGDIYMFSRRDRVIGVLGDPEGGDLIGLKINKGEFPVSICASSSTIGHSLSFGHGDLVVVRSVDAAIADAAATALCNILHGPADVDRVLKKARAAQKKGLDGVLARCGESMGVWGKMELIQL